MDGDSLLAVVPAVTVALDICPRTPKAIVRKLLEKAEPFPTGGRNPLWPALWHYGSDHGRLVWVHLQATQVPTLLETIAKLKIRSAASVLGGFRLLGAALRTPA